MRATPKLYYFILMINSFFNYCLYNNIPQTQSLSGKQLGRIQLKKVIPFKTGSH